MTRVAVFIDYQNVYMGARRAFGYGSDPAQLGQIFPRRLGVMLTDLGRSVDPTRQLEYVSIFRGEPSPAHSPRSQAACDRQVRFWGAQAGVRVRTRPLKYYQHTDSAGLRRFAAREKGIDVLVALEMVVGAIRDQYDVAVLFSGDTDLLPAVEQVVVLGKRCEVAAWTSDRSERSRLRLPRLNLWCHWLDEKAFRLVEDPTDYNYAQPAPPSPTP